MNTPRWSADMRLGIPEIDVAHKAFLQQVEHLEQADDDQFCAAFLAMVARLEFDFREEELLMEEMDFAGLSAHREQHARVLGALHQATGHLMQGNLAVARHAVALLGQWFVVHLATLDTVLALTLELAQNERAAVQEPPMP